jgi:hypothetical protein
MNTKSPLTKRIEIHFDKMTERNVVEFLDLFPSRMSFIKQLIYVEFRKYKRNPTQYKKQHGLVKKETLAN